MSLSFLQELGFSENEICLYEWLLKLGEVPVVVLIQKTKLKRATVYKSLYSLEEKGLATKKELKRKIHFRPEPPTKLLELAQQQYQNVDRVRLSLESSIPILSSLYTQAVERPIVKIYEGVEGLKEIYLDTLEEGKDIFSVLQTRTTDPQLHKWLTAYYAKKRAKMKIHAKVIIASGGWADEYQKRNRQENRTTLLVPDNLFPFQHEVDIYGDKVAFINYSKDEPLIGVVIKHPKIAATMKAWFDLAWKGAATF